MNAPGDPELAQRRQGDPRTADGFDITCQFRAQRRRKSDEDAAEFRARRAARCKASGRGFEFRREIADHVGPADVLEKAVGALIDLANARGGEDNITVVLLRWGESD